MSGPADDPRIEAALAAVPADASDLSDFRESAAFEALEREMHRLEREGPSVVSWPLVARDGLAALAGGAKDLSVACWCCLALAVTEGLSGIATGLAVVDGVAERFWDVATPTRPRARAGVFDWLAARAAVTVPAELAPGQAPAAVAAFASLDALDRRLNEKLLGNPVSLGDLLRPLRALSAQATAELARSTAALPEPPLPAPSVPAPLPASAISPAETSPTASSVSLPIPVGVPVDTGRPEQAFSTLHDAVRTAALALMEVDLADWRPFRLLRAVTWLAVDEPPPAPAGLTALMPPSATRIADLDALAAAGSGRDLVLALERFCSASGLFWLDGQRRSALALAALGPVHAAAAREVAAGTLSLLDRLPGIEGLAFEDGTPFADHATRAWLATLRPQPAAAVAAAVASADTAPWLTGLALAREVAAHGDADAALAALRDGTNAAPDGRSRMCWRLSQARLCFEVGLPDIALALLRGLDQEADRLRLEEWEPNLAAEIGALLYQCTVSPGLADPSAVQNGEAGKAFSRTARSDPVAAARLLRTPFSSTSSR